MLRDKGKTFDEHVDVNIIFPRTVIVLDKLPRFKHVCLLSTLSVDKTSYFFPEAL